MNTQLVTRANRLVIAFAICSYRIFYADVDSAEQFTHDN